MHPTKLLLLQHLEFHMLQLVTRFKYVYLVTSYIANN